MITENKKTNRRLWTVSVVVLMTAILPQYAFAAGDGPRAHSKEVLTETNWLSMTFVHASGNTSPTDPSSRIVPNMDFDADLMMLGYGRTFDLFGRTAVATVLLPVGELEGSATGGAAFKSSARGIGDPVFQLDVNLIGAPAMKNIPQLMNYEPKFTVDIVGTLGVPVGEYDEESPTNIGQNRWFGRVALPVMVNLCEWVPGRKTTFEVTPAVWVFGDNDDFLGQKMQTDPMFELEGHLTRDLTDKLWASLDAIYYGGAKSTIGGMSSGSLGDFAVGFTVGYKINENMSLTAGYTTTLGSGGSDDLDLNVFTVNLIFGWHDLVEGIRRLGDAK
jgi:hypothetical protein